MPYDVAAGSTLTSHNILGKKLFAGGTTCIDKYYAGSYHGFSPTGSALDLHAPGNNTLPRYPDLNLNPSSLDLLYQNDYGVASLERAPHKNFGYPHVKHPNNHYDMTPFDAICANAEFDETKYQENTIHVEDPNPYVTEFLIEELTPSTLFLSNRIIQDESAGQKYYADFEARNSILAGNQNIYKHLDPVDRTQWYKRLQTSPGDFIVADNAVVTMRAGNDDGNSAVVLGAGFSAKAGSIFRAYVQPGFCTPFSYASQRIGVNTNPPAQNDRHILVKPLAPAAANTSGEHRARLHGLPALYPNPSDGSIFYAIEDNDSYEYTLTDACGHELQTGRLDKTGNQLNLTTFDPGIYFITISNRQHQQTDKIILQ